ncbi:hypothetical protein V8G54_012498 [Vigna mungo]|uniref:Uncharacterized protein n=1 Tax=Vigna mungo TaxID=3915 RepID=A0AAQ3NUB9_VIGMU
MLQLTGTRGIYPVFPVLSVQRGKANQISFSKIPGLWFIFFSRPGDQATVWRWCDQATVCRWRNQATFVVARGGAWAILLLLLLFRFGFDFGYSCSLLSFQVQMQFRVGRGDRRDFVSAA